jgi:hypothetical protein
MVVADGVMAPLGVLSRLGAEDGILPTTTTSAADTYGLSSLLRLPGGQLHWFTRPAGGDSVLQPAAIDLDPFEIPCDVSGSVTLSASIADDTLQVLTAGDWLSTTFRNCDDGNGTVLNGGLQIDVLVGVDLGLTPPYQFRFRSTFSDLSVARGSDVYRADGTVTMVESTADGVRILSEVSGSRLRVTADGHEQTLTDFLLTGSYDDASGAFSIDVRGLEGCCAALESTALGGTVAFFNEEQFVGVGTDNPDSGSHVIRGAAAASGPSAVLIDVLDALCIDLLVDEDGNGAPDATIRTSWESLPTHLPDDCK